LGSAIDLRTKVSIKDSPGGLNIVAGNLALTGFSLDVHSGRIFSDEAIFTTRYVRAALKEFQAEDIRVKVESEIPLASGLGSSAATVVATIAALNAHMELKLSTKDIADHAHRIEKEVQTGLGSPMDTALSTFGGYCMVSREAQPIDLPQLELVIGYTEKPHDTRSEVQKVQGLYARYPEIIEPIFQSIGAVSDRAVQLIREQNREALGKLMNINHGLLEAVGVGSRELSELVYAARGAGRALGAKITGAGGGGCMIALPCPEGQASIVTAIEQARGRAFPVRTGCQGVRLED
jgi:mevalonate kinase